MYYIIQVDGIFRTPISKSGRPERYEEPRYFKTLKGAKKWVERNTYKGMSWKYEIVRLEECTE